MKNWSYRCSFFLLFFLDRQTVWRPEQVYANLKEREREREKKKKKKKKTKRRALRYACIGAPG